ncbi:MAG: hypothetical protein RR942_14560 [Romboutsia sp.]
MNNQLSDKEKEIIINSLKVGKELICDYRLLREIFIYNNTDISQIPILTDRLIKVGMSNNKINLKNNII